MVKNIFSIYKPKGPTSFDIITQLRKITGLKKIGHAGTLDPLAEGVLVIGIGHEATRNLDTEVKKEKEYVAEIKLGFNSTTDDNEGEKSLPPLTPPYEGGEKIRKPTQKEIEKILKRFTGNIFQTPPIYSAIKINGQPAYKSARQGKEIKMVARAVEIKQIKIVSYKYPNLKIKVTTGKGVYIRSLARDIGAALKTGGYLAGLKRTRVGEFNLKNCLILEEFSKKFIAERNQNVIKILKNGGIGVLPTDTIYGLVGQALKPETVERIYKVRKRQPDKPFIILISSIADLKKFGIRIKNTPPPARLASESVAGKQPSPYKGEGVYRGVLEKYWPGPVSIILPCENPALAYLHRGTKSLAFRLPAQAGLPADSSPLRRGRLGGSKSNLLKILKQTGPLVAPSANPEGLRPAKNIKEAEKYFGKQIDFYADAGELSALPSTLIRITNNHIEVLRQGAVKI